MTQTQIQRDLAAEIDELRDKLKAVGDDTKAIGNMLTGDPIRFFSIVNKSKRRLDVSTAIAVLAFLFSFGTTIVSYVHTNNQDTSSAKAELRTLLQRLAAITKEIAAANIRYRNDYATYNTVSSTLNQENVLIAGQADQLIGRLPKGEVTATDYVSIANALMQSARYEKAAIAANSALAISQESDDNSSALWVLGSADFALGKIGDGRAHYQKALDLFGQKYRSVDEATKQSTNILTELNWAASENLVRNTDLVEQHLRSAERILASVPASITKDMTKSQIDQMRKSLAEANASDTVPNSVSQPVAPAGIPPRPPPTQQPRNPIAR